MVAINYFKYREFCKRARVCPFIQSMHADRYVNIVCTIVYMHVLATRERHRPILLVQKLVFNMSEKTAGDCLREMWAKLSAALSANPATTKALAEGLFQRKIIPNATRQEIAHSMLGGGQMSSTLMSSVDAALRTSYDGGRKVITALIEELREQGLDDLSKELSKKYS